VRRLVQFVAMRTLVSVLGYANLALFTLVAVAALREWRAGRGRAGLWAALTFGALAVVVDVERIVPDDPTTTAELVASKALVGLLVLFPYFLYRFTTAFQPPTVRLERLLGAMTVVLLAATFATPEFPEAGEPRPAWFLTYLVAFLAHWTVFAVVVAVRLWRAGSGEPSIARRRMRLLALASIAITTALLLAAVGPGEGSGLDLAVTLLVMVSALAFLLGLAPPQLLRMVWRRPEQREVQAAVTHLVRATTAEEVAREVLPPMARIVGARAIALQGLDGRTIAAHGASEEMLDAVSVEEWDEEDAAHRGNDVSRVDVPSGSLLVWRSPYAPFFGSDELELLRTLGALTGLALDRSRLFAHEREARLALERADEVKTNFVALAAHELRTPVATIDGIIQTLRARGDRLPQDHRRLLEETLRHQSSHMRVLVDQLLDLSRLDADALPIAPRRLPVHERVETVVASAAGGRADEVRIEIDPDLEAVADPTAFERIVSNLVVNAFRYGAPPVLIRADERDESFRLTVEDRGGGVPPDFVPDLFERFTRSGSTRERVAGTGLGLAIARSYATAHGGDLRYENASPHGACFELLLPVADAPRLEA
jgi:signal transduction histidine kinase